MKTLYVSNERTALLGEGSLNSYAEQVTDDHKGLTRKTSWFARKLFRSSPTTLRFSNGTTYLGMVRGGKPHGRGQMTFADTPGVLNKKYDGDYRDGRMNGNGSLTWETTGRNKALYTEAGVFKEDRFFRGDQISETQALDGRGHKMVLTFEKSELDSGLI